MKSADGDGPEGGFSHAQYVLGEMYFAGNGVVAPNRAEAERWLKKALAQGNPSAMVLLAKMYTGPTGVPLNPTLVYDLYRAAAASKHKQAEYELGIFYRAGFIGRA